MSRRPGLVVLRGGPGAGRSPALPPLGGAFRGPAYAGGGAGGAGRRGRVLLRPRPPTRALDPAPGTAAAPPPAIGPATGTGTAPDAGAGPEDLVHAVAAALADLPRPARTALAALGLI